MLLIFFPISLAFCYIVITCCRVLKKINVRIYSYTCSAQIIHKMYHNCSCYIFAYNSWLHLPYVVYFLCVFPSYCIYMNIYEEKAFGSIFVLLFNFFFFPCFVFYIFVSFCNLFIFWLCLSLFPLFQMLFLSSMKPKLIYHISLFFFFLQIIIHTFGISPSSSL